MRSFLHACTDNPPSSLHHTLAPPDTGVPLVPFGHGMSYSTFALACAGGLSPDRTSVRVACNLSHTAGPAGDEVLMVHHRASQSVVARIAGAHPVPYSALIDFERVAVAAGATVAVFFDVPVTRALVLTTEDGSVALYPGMHFVDVVNGVGLNVSVPVSWADADTDDVAGRLVIKRRPQPPSGV